MGRGASRHSRAENRVCFSRPRAPSRSRSSRLLRGWRWRLGRSCLCQGAVRGSHSRHWALEGGEAQTLPAPPAPARRPSDNPAPGPFVPWNMQVFRSFSGRARAELNAVVLQHSSGFGRGRRRACVHAHVCACVCKRAQTCVRVQTCVHKCVCMCRCVLQTNKTTVSLLPLRPSTSGSPGGSS